MQDPSTTRRGRHSHPVEYLSVWGRATVLFLLLLLISKALGKRQMSQLTFFDFVVLITTAAIGGSSVAEIKEPPGPKWVGIIILAGYGYISAWVAMKSKATRGFMDGEPTVLIRNGKILEGNMRKLRMTFQELMTELRKKGVFEIEQVEFALMEIDGSLSVLKKSQFRSVTPHDMKIPTEYEGCPVDLIVDGVVIEENLRDVHLDRQWLLKQLAEQNIDDPKSVAYAVLNSAGKLYIDEFHGTN